MLKIMGKEDCNNPGYSTMNRVGRTGSATFHNSFGFWSSEVDFVIGCQESVGVYDLPLIGFWADLPLKVDEHWFT